MFSRMVARQNARTKAGNGALGASCWVPGMLPTLPRHMVLIVSVFPTCSHSERPLLQILEPLGNWTPNPIPLEFRLPYQNFHLGFQLFLEKNCERGVVE